MGQYYHPIILANKNSKNNKEVISMFMDSWVYQNGSKLLEHSYIDNPFVSTFEFELSPYGMFYNSRVVWAGDYADPEENDEENKNLYHIISELEEKGLKNCYKPNPKNTSNFRYILNHSKKEFVDKKGRLFHPLPLLTAEGNGRGGGDYRGEQEELVGRWSRDYISVEEFAPEEYTELKYKFSFCGETDFEEIDESEESD
jgi:hypothetical protein